MKPLTKIYWLRFALGITAAFLCIGYSIATGTIYTNLVLNNSVETGASTPQDWSGNGTVSTTARTGSRSLRINVTNDNAIWIGTVKPVNGESTYHIQGYFKGDVEADDQFYLVIRWFSDSKTDPIVENKVAIPKGNNLRWLPVGGDFTAPKSAKSCEIVFEAVNGTGDVYGDDFEVRQTESLTKITTGASLAIVTYLVSYYFIKFKFIHEVEKPRKLFTTGIGIYFLSWIIFWILLYTLFATYL